MVVIPWKPRMGYVVKFFAIDGRFPPCYWTEDGKWNHLGKAPLKFFETELKAQLRIGQIYTEFGAACLHTVDGKTESIKMDYAIEKGTEVDESHIATVVVMKSYKALIRCEGPGLNGFQRGHAELLLIVRCTMTWSTCCGPACGSGIRQLWTI